MVELDGEIGQVFGLESHRVIVISDEGVSEQKFRGWDGVFEVASLQEEILAVEKIS